MILLYCCLFTVLPYFTVLIYCGKRLLSLHNFFLMRSHGDISVLPICDCHVTQLHGYTSALKQDLWKSSGFTNTNIDSRTLRKFKSLRTRLLLHGKFNFIVQLLIISSDNPLSSYLIYTYTRLFILLYIHIISFKF